MSNKFISIIITLLFVNVFVLKAENSKTSSMTIPVGTSIPLIMDYSISSKKTHKGSVVEFKVAQDIYINDRIVIPMGTPAIGEIIKASKRKCWGKPGKLAIK